MANANSEQPKHKCVYCTEFVSSAIYSEHMKSCIEKSKSPQNPMEKDKKNAKRKSKIINPKTSQGQNLASFNPDSNSVGDQKRNSQNLQVQKNPHSPMIGKDKKSNLKVFPCVLSQECHEKFQTTDEVEKHGTKSHKDLGIGNKDINELLLGDFKSESDRLKTYAGNYLFLNSKVKQNEF